jgi:Holliday junction resolvase RusA-like endonuclease
MTEPLLDIFIPTEPRAKQRPRHMRNGHTYTPWATIEAERVIRYAVRAKHLAPVFQGAVELYLTVVIARPKTVKRPYPTITPDLDNYLKLVQDALNGLVWRDDAQVVHSDANKIYCNEKYPRAGYDIKVKVREVA